RMNMQIAEPAAEGEMLLRGDVLVAEEDHEGFGERAMDLGHGPGRQRTGEIDTGNLRADDRRELFDADGLIGFGFTGGVPITGPLLAGQRADALPLPFSDTALICGAVLILLRRRHRRLVATAVALVDIVDH